MSIQKKVLWTKKKVSEEMYSTLVEVQNAMCNEYGF